MSERPAGDLDWTRDETGHSNSSREYLCLVAEVERIIRGSAHALISGRADSVARTIVSNLAHKHGMRLCDDAQDRGLMSAKAGGAQQLVEESPNRASGDEGLSAAPSAAFASEATLYLGSHHATSRWWRLGIPLFVSVRVIGQRKRLPVAVAPWALDSGGFTELSKPPHRWLTTEDEYVEQIERLQEIGSLAWVAPQDWMCEPFMVEKTGLSVREHQERTVASFVSLRERVGSLVIPVLQGYAPREYDRCVELYRDAGVDLQAEPVVGLGSVCRRSRTSEAIRLVHYLADHNLRLHGFGLKGDTFRALRYVLVSADSMAWSFRGRHEPGCGPSHKSEANCPRFAMRWRDQLLTEDA